MRQSLLIFPAIGIISSAPLMGARARFTLHLLIGTGSLALPIQTREGGGGARLNVEWGGGDGSQAGGDGAPLPPRSSAGAAVAAAPFCGGEGELVGGGSCHRLWYVGTPLHVPALSYR